MISKGIYRYTILPRDLDFNREATFVSICNYILAAAGEDADLNGFGLRDLNLSKSTWVLSRMAVQCERPLVEGDVVNIRTWVSDVGRMMTTRNMVFEDSRGNRLGAAVTLWAIIDIEKRAALDIREKLDYSNAVRDIPSPIAPPARITKVTPGSTTPHRVAYSDMDFNCHASSTKYMEWMTDLLPQNFHTEKILRRADINFVHEARFGELLTIGIQEEELKTLFDIHNDQGLSICRASMDWIPRGIPTGNCAKQTPGS